MDFMDILKYIVIAVIAYIVGNFSTGSFLASRANVDLRSKGSGNIGMTNTMRVMGKWAGALTLLGDALKAVLAVAFGMLLMGRSGGLLAGVCVILGHDFPVFSGFKGGKGIASTLGVALMIHPLYVLIILITVAAILWLTHYMSLASLLGALLLFLMSFFLNIADYGGWIFSLIALVLAAFTHRENIQRLREGKENRI